MTTRVSKKKLNLIVLQCQCHHTTMTTHFYRFCVQMQSSGTWIKHHSFFPPKSEICSVLSQIQSLQPWMPQPLANYGIWTPFHQPSIMEYHLYDNISSKIIIIFIVFLQPLWRHLLCYCHHHHHLLLPISMKTSPLMLSSSWSCSSSPYKLKMTRSPIMLSSSSSSSYNLYDNISSPKVINIIFFFFLQTRWQHPFSYY